MKAKTNGFVAALLFALVSLAAFAASDRGTEAEAQALVKKAIQYYDKVGREKALAEFSKSPGPWVDRDLYLTVYNMSGVCLSHVNARMVGKDMMELRDADGVYITRERVKAAAAAPNGWQDYKFYNPVSRKVEPKHMYWEKHDGIIFASGAYRLQ